MVEANYGDPRNVDAFRRAVLADDQLQHALRETADEEAFIQQFVQFGAARGYRFAPADVAAALRASRRAWFERWIPR